MNLCSREHDEVCYESRNCPACEYGDEIASKKDAELKAAARQIDDLESQVYDLQQELAAKKD